MPGALSIETQVDTTRIAVGCESRGHFIAIARALGAKISAAEYSRAMNDQKVLDRKIWEKLSEVVVQMVDLQTAVGVPVRWADTDLVTSAMVGRLVSKVAKELNLPERNLVGELADEAVKGIKQ